MYCHCVQATCHVPLPSMSSQSLSSSPFPRCYIPLLAIWIENNSFGIKLSTLTFSLASVWLVRLCRRFAFRLREIRCLRVLFNFGTMTNRCIQCTSTCAAARAMHSRSVLLGSRRLPISIASARPTAMLYIVWKGPARACYWESARPLRQRKDPENREAHDVEAPARHAFYELNQQVLSPLLRFDCFRRGVSDRCARMGNTAGSLYEDRALVLASCSSETFINFYHLMASTNFTTTSSAWLYSESSMALSCSSTRRRARRTRPNRRATRSSISSATA